MRLGFAKAHYNISPRIKSGHGPWLGEFTKIWGSPLIFLEWQVGEQLGFAKVHYNITHKRKWLCIFH